MFDFDTDDVTLTNGTDANGDHPHHHHRDRVTPESEKSAQSCSGDCAVRFSSSCDTTDVSERMSNVNVGRLLFAMLAHAL